MYVGPNIAPRLAAELRDYSSFRARILAEIPDLDAETLADTLEGITDLRKMLAEIIRSALEDEALAVGLSTRLNDMKARRHARHDIFALPILPTFRLQPWRRYRSRSV